MICERDSASNLAASGKGGLTSSCLVGEKAPRMMMAVKPNIMANGPARTVILTLSLGSLVKVTEELGQNNIIPSVTTDSTTMMIANIMARLLKPRQDFTSIVASAR